MLKGHVFSHQLFESQIFALFINTFLNGEDGISNNYKNGMAVSYNGSDVTISSGAVCIQGRFSEEDSSTTLSAGTDNAYNKLVIEINLDEENTESDFAQGHYKIVTSTTGYPALTQNNIIKNNAGIYQYELARFRTSSNGISDFQDKRTFLDFNSLYTEIRNHIRAIDDEGIWLLKTGGEMTGPISIQTGSINSFIHKRNINSETYKTRVGTGQYYQDGSASIELSKNDEVLGKLEVRADGKIYNGKTGDSLVENTTFMQHVSQNDTEFSTINGNIRTLGDQYTNLLEQFNAHERQNDATFSEVNSSIYNMKNSIQTLSSEQTIGAHSNVSKLLNYPSGFSKDNSYLLSKMYSNNNGTSWNGVDHTTFLQFDVIFRTNGIELNLTNNTDTSYKFNTKIAIMRV